MIRFVFSCLVYLFVLNAAADTRGVLNDALEKARSGQTMLEDSVAKAGAGDGQASQDSYDAAQALFRQVVSLCHAINPDELDASEEAILYGQSMELSAEYDLAARGFERAYRLSPANYQVGIIAARNWRRVGKAGMTRAFTLLEELRGDSGLDESISGKLYSEFGRAYHARGHFELASEMYAKVLETGVAPVDTRIGAAVLAVRRGEFEVASGAIARLPMLTPEQGRFLDEELGASLNAVDELRVPIGEHHYAYAQLLVRVGRNYDALLALEHAVLVDDSNFAMYNLLGGLLMQQRMQERAVAAYERSLALNPDQARTREILGRIQSQN